MGRAGSWYPSRATWVRMVTTHSHMLLHISSIPLPGAQSYQVPKISAAMWQHVATFSCIYQKVKCPSLSSVILGSDLKNIFSQEKNLPFISISPLKHRVQQWGPCSPMDIVYMCFEGFFKTAHTNCSLWDLHPIHPSLWAPFARMQPG